MSGAAAQHLGPGRPGWNAGQTFPSEVLPAAEVDAMVRLASCRGKAIIAVLYRGGLRIAELTALRPVDVDTRAGTIHVRHGKGDQERTVGIDPGAALIVDAWLEQRRGLHLRRSPGAALEDAPPLFCTRQGLELAPQYVRLMLRRLARRAGVERRVHPHALRHSMAAGMAREGIPLPLIQAQLGHRSLTSTDRYVRHLQGQHIAAAAARPWSPA